MNRSTFADLANKFLKRDIVKSAGISGTAASMLVAIALGNAVPASAQQLRDVTIAFPSEAIASSSLRIANEMGLFEKHGIRPKFIRMENASVSTAAVVAGSVDFTIHGSSDLIAAQASGQKLVTVANLYGKFGNFLVISKAEAEKRGLSSTSPLPDRVKALEGLLIAGTSATAAVLIAVRATAKAAGVEARYTYMSQENMPSALESGAIQGFAAATPTWTFPVVRGAALLWLSGPRGDFPPEYSPATASLLSTRRDFAQANPDLMKTLVAIQADFAETVDKDRAAVKAAVVRLYPKLDMQIIDIYFENEATAWQSKPFTAKEMLHEIDFMKNSGVVPAERLSNLTPAEMVYP